MIKIIEEKELFIDNNVSKLMEKHTIKGSFYNLGWGNLDPKMIKYKIPKILFNKNDLSIYWNSRGLDDLIDQIIVFIKKKSGVNLARKNILVTNGSTNSIFLLSYFFKNFVKINTVFLQNPTYDTAINIFKSQKYIIKTIDSNFKNIKNYRAKLCYLSFKLHNPTGESFSKKQEIKIKNKLLKNSYLIEDDAYGLFENQNNINLVNHEKYIYAGSFSKYIFPGIRMGYIIANEDIINKLALVQKYYNSHPNILSQLTLIHYLKTGKIDQEINHKIKIINEKRKIFESILDPKVKKLIKDSKAGFYYWLRLPSGIGSKKLFLDLLKKGVFVIPGDIYFSGKPYGAIRISISRISKKDLKTATKIINEVFKGYE